MNKITQKQIDQAVKGSFAIYLRAKEEGKPDEAACMAARLVYRGHALGRAFHLFSDREIREGVCRCKSCRQEVFAGFKDADIHPESIVCSLCGGKFSGIECPCVPKKAMKDLLDLFKIRIRSGEISKVRILNCGSKPDHVYVADGVAACGEKIPNRSTAIILRPAAELDKWLECVKCRIRLEM